ncbi:RNA-directed DNA polymerase [Paenibacillus sp. cl6col]|uniref:retron St85 family RNA-directed DNA polymerase n=1 Tax=Paenibacillus sp. cl6col TaxID=1761878 RepID=UPI0008827713|nr:retron St85 family RNA-directed DNA polymerase [Paenibacillus sp. cl6col]SDF84926.1 RNA-directed DNA polymerase [Paenibacillus sp. cl6col]
MNWDDYKNRFYHFAKYDNKDDNYIDSCLNYAEKLFLKDIPVIYDVTHFSKLVGYKEAYIMKVSNSQGSFYREFKIPKKKKGEYRDIYEPLPNLKNIQRWILDEILNKLKPSPYSKAFRVGYSIKDNAKYHRNQKKLLNLDIKDYFKSIGYKKVYNFFRSLGYSKHVSVVLANVCTLDDELPQGAPTSPMLSNLITQRLDLRIAKFASKNKIRYTRYADDLTFSGDFEEGIVINFVRKVLLSDGFLINEQKTRVRKQNQQQEVTGIVVNEKLQASKKYRKSLRQKIYYIKRYGLEDHISKIEFDNKIRYLYHLLGTANFILNVNPNDEEAKEYFNYLKQLLFQYKLKKLDQEVE